MNNFCWFIDLNHTLWDGWEETKREKAHSGCIRFRKLPGNFWNPSLSLQMNSRPRWQRWITCWQQRDNGALLIEYTCTHMLFVLWWWRLSIQFNSIGIFHPLSFPQFFFSLCKSLSCGDSWCSDFPKLNLTYVQIICVLDCLVHYCYTCKFSSFLLEYLFLYEKMH